MRLGASDNPELMERAERTATYIVLTLLLGGELLGLFVKPVSRALSGTGAITLLAAALLLVFRLIDRHLSAARTEVESNDFGEALRLVTALHGGPVDVRVLANDGTKYYSFLSETKLNIARLRVLLSDARYAPKWQRICERGIATSVCVRQTTLTPALHYMIVGQSGAMFGLFLRSAGRASPDRTFTVHGSTASGRDLTASLAAHFEREWERIDDGDGN